MNLKFKEHIEKLCNKFKGRLNAFARLITYMESSKS